MGVLDLCSLTMAPFLVPVLSGPNVAQHLMVNSRTVATLTFSWDAPVSGRVSEYKIKLLDVSWTEQTISGCATRKVIFTGLTAGAEYTVGLVTESGDQQSEMVEGHFYTGKCNSFYCMTDYCQELYDYELKPEASIQKSKTSSVDETGDMQVMK